MRAAQRDFGRVDWMSRAKVWRVIWYESRSIEIGRYPTYEEAAAALQSAVQHQHKS